MTPLRRPLPVRGDVPGLLCLGMPVCGYDDDSTGAIVCDYCTAIPEPLYRVGWGEPRGEEDVPGRLLPIDWSSPLAIYAALNWIADLGHHPCLWMLPTTHGGKVEGQQLGPGTCPTCADGGIYAGSMETCPDCYGTGARTLSAWEVSAILVSASVLRVAAGGRPVADLLGTWSADAADDLVDVNGWPTNRCAQRHGLTRRMRVGSLSVGRHRSVSGWAYERCGFFGHRFEPLASGPETGAAGMTAADAAALADGAALLVNGGVAVLAPGAP